jgi:hypothetical protein
MFMNPTINNQHTAQNNINIHNENDFLIHHSTNMFQEEDLGRGSLCLEYFNCKSYLLVKNVLNERQPLKKINVKNREMRKIN